MIHSSPKICNGVVDIPFVIPTGLNQKNMAKWKVGPALDFPRAVKRAKYEDGFFPSSDGQLFVSCFRASVLVLGIPN